MRRVIGALFIFTALLVAPPALFMESMLGDIIFFASPALFVAGIALMSRRPSAQEVAEGMVRKDLLGSALVLGALATRVGAIVVVSRFLN